MFCFLVDFDIFQLLKRKMQLNLRRNRYVGIESKFKKNNYVKWSRNGQEKHASRDHERRRTSTCILKQTQSDWIFDLFGFWLSDFDDFFFQSYQNFKRSSNLHGRTCVHHVWGALGP